MATGFLDPYYEMWNLELSADWLPCRRLEGRVPSIAGLERKKKKGKARSEFEGIIMK